MLYLEKELWPPQYVPEAKRRHNVSKALKTRPDLVRAMKLYYKDHPHEFINDWGITYDPRNAGSTKPTHMPFILFERQAEMVTFLTQLIKQQESGLIEKARDMGATWTAVAFSVWGFLFREGMATGWGSRKEQLVDRIGDPDSIFEKMRMQLDVLPKELLPHGFSLRKHATYMRIVNPENGNSITGESGDNIGRGGRKTIYFKDESAHYERPEMIQAALDDNTNVQVDISSVNGPGNVFYRRRQAGVLWEHEVKRGKTHVFVMDWRDHPAKTQEWYNYREAKARDEGLTHKFEQEVNRNYTASVEGIIIPAAWVSAAIDAHLRLGIEITGRRYAGLDVADEGGDKNALVSRVGILCDLADHWAKGDQGVTTHRALTLLKPLGALDLDYDSVGVGAGVKTETNRLRREGVWPKSIGLVSWSGGAKPLKPEEYYVPGDKETPKNKDFYRNLKAQAWWQTRLRFERTYRAVTEPGYTYKPEDLISISSKLANIEQLKVELSQPTIKYDAVGRILVDKRPEGTRSPNLGDAFVMAYWPSPTNDLARIYEQLGKAS